MRGAAWILAGLLAAGAATAGEHLVEAPGPSGALKGTLSRPADGAGAPVVLIAPGSGPTDRDGNNPLGIRAAPYRLLAEALAARGIASVRIDKRGMFASRAAVADADAVTVAGYAADIAAWARVAAAETGNDCTWIAGHSEGALVALAATRSPAPICGLVLVSGAGRPMGDVLRHQLAANPANAPLLKDAMAAIDALEAGRRVDAAGLPPPLRLLFPPSVQSYLADLFSFDPAELLKAYPGPVLVMQGTSDLQIGVADAERLAAARPGVALAILPGVNHVLKQAPADDRAANIATYADPGLELAPGVADRIANFVRGGR